MTAAGERVKVLYIGGTGRTGSTVLEKILAQAPGVFAGGELTFLWRFRDSGRCSCGEALRECAVWAKIFTSAFGGLDAVDPREMVALRRRYRSAHLPLMASRRLRARLLARTGPFPARVEALYRAIRDVTGAGVIVDSSKEPHYSEILASRPGLDVRFLHLVRDARAVAHSWSRHREQRGLDSGDLMERRGPVKSSIYYDVSNLAAEALWARPDRPYLRMRYEDLVADPEAARTELERFVEHPFHLDLREGTLDVAPTHSAWGNPNRFESGTVRLRPDDAWRSQMPARARAVVTTMTWPLLVRYGYPLRSGG